MNNITNKLSLEFSNVLKSWLTTEEMAAMIIANKEETCSNVCHSHDYCDANMAMDEAWDKIMGRKVDLDSDVDIAIWSRAWDDAKESNFYTWSE